MNFLAVGLFYIEYTNEVYYMTVEFINDAKRLPNDSITDIVALVNEINNLESTLPFNAICVDIDVIIDMRGNILWEHSGDVVYNKYIGLVSLKEITKKREG